MRLLYLLGFGYLGLSLAFLIGRLPWFQHHSIPQSTSPEPVPYPVNPTAQQWFERIKPQCNAVEAVTALRSLPPPDTHDGTAYAAGCYALAGKISQARATLEDLPAEVQSYAAGIVFSIGHPVADMGDDESSGPIMELVLEYQPENFMALYHAGMSQYILGDLERSQQHLKTFLDIYRNDDGWRQNTLTVLERIEESPSETGLPDDIFKGGH
jgi:hypothetical protein